MKRGGKGALLSKILVVEDEKNVGLTLTERLKKENFEVNWVHEVAEAKLFVQQCRYDLALIDVGLPDGSGFDVARWIRAHSPSTALIFLTAWGDPEHRIRGLELGAEDYIVKPFHLKELLLRIQNGLKRARSIPAESVRIGRALIHFAKFEAEVEGQIHALTHKECALLKLLVDRRGHVVSRDEILNQVWSDQEFPSSRTVDNFIVRLRRLVEADPENPQLIKSIRGVGYQLHE